MYRAKIWAESASGTDIRGLQISFFDLLQYPYDLQTGGWNTSLTLVVVAIIYHIVYKTNKTNQTNSFRLTYLKIHIVHKSLALKTKPRFTRCCYSLLVVVVVLIEITIMTHFVYDRRSALFSVLIQILIIASKRQLVDNFTRIVVSALLLRHVSHQKAHSNRHWNLTNSDFLHSKRSRQMISKNRCNNREMIQSTRFCYEQMSECHLLFEKRQNRKREKMFRWFEFDCDNVFCHFSKIRWKVR